MNITELISRMQKDLDDTYKISSSISVQEMGEGDFNLRIALSNGDSCSIGCDLMLFYTHIDAELAIINPPDFMEPVFRLIERIAKSNIIAIRAFEGIFANCSHSLVYTINGTRYPNYSLHSFSEIKWSSIGIRLNSSFIPVLDRFDFHYDSIKQFVIDFVGFVLLFSGTYTSEAVFLREEGVAYETSGIKYERNPINREICLRSKGFHCSVCGVNLEDEYGEIAHEFIEVHHAIPVSSYGEARFIDPIAELFPVCPNCHSMLHRRNPPYSVEELRSIRMKAKSKKRENGK